MRFVPLHITFILLWLPIISTWGKPIRQWEGNWAIELHGFTLHPEMILGIMRHENHTLPEMPRAIDFDQKYMYTPGFLVGYNTRRPSQPERRAWEVFGIYFRDCYETSVWVLGGGPVWRFKLFKNWLTEVSLLAFLMSIEQPHCPLYDENLIPILAPKNWVIGAVYEMPVKSGRRIQAFALPAFRLLYRFDSGACLGIACEVATIQIQFALHCSIPISPTHKPISRI